MRYDFIAAVGFAALPAVVWAVPLASASASYRLDGVPGQVSAITITPRNGGRIVADRFLSSPPLATDEKIAFAAATVDRMTCGFAAAARPFTRLRRFSASGRLLWAWNIDRDEQALRLLAVGENDCLSPDGTRLTVAIYRSGPLDAKPTELRLGDGVVAVGVKPRFVEAKGKRTGEAFGHPRFTGLLGWRAGTPATLVFEVNRDDAATPVIDQAELVRRGYRAKPRLRTH